MKTISLALFLSLLLILLPGCGKTDTSQELKMTAPAKAGSIVINIGEQLAVQHEAQAGETLEWKPNSPKTPNFWIQFVGTSPCTNGALVLSGNDTKAASCVAGSATGASGTITYSYYIRASLPPSTPPTGPTADRLARCEGCNN